MLQLRGEGPREPAPFQDFEEGDTDDPSEAARWVRIYSELVGLHEDRLVRLGVSRRPPPQAKARLTELRARLDAWRQRHLDLAGIDFDSYGRILTAGGRTQRLTKRESQLLDFLMDRPGQYFPADVLIREAWQDAHLAPEQVRTYVVRLRRKLAEAEVPATLVNRQRQGYALILEKGDLQVRRDSSS